MNRAVFSGGYVDLRFIKTRSVAAITVEIPIEQAAAFVAAFGAPNPATECPVAIARIDPKKAASEAPIQSGEAKDRRPFKTLPLPQQAALRCGDAAFQRFVAEEFAEQWDNDGTPENTANFVRWYCGVKSRSAIKENTSPGDGWLYLMKRFDAWMAVAA